MIDGFPERLSSLSKNPGWDVIGQDARNAIGNWYFDEYKYPRYIQSYVDIFGKSCGKESFTSFLNVWGVDVFKILGVGGAAVFIWNDLVAFFFKIWFAAEYFLEAEVVIVFLYFLGDGRAGFFGSIGVNKAAKELTRISQIEGSLVKVLRRNFVKKGFSGVKKAWSKKSAKYMNVFVKSTIKDDFKIQFAESFLNVLYYWQNKLKVFG